MTNSDPIDQQLRKELTHIIGTCSAIDGHADAPTHRKNYEDDEQTLDLLEALFDTYAARRAGLGDSDSSSETAQPSEIKSVHPVPSKRQELLIRIDETKIIEAKLESVGAMKDVQWRRHQLRDELTAVNGMTTDSPDTNNQDTQSRKGSL